MAFLLRRLAFYVAAFLVAATFNFLLPRLLPGDPVETMFAQSGTALPPESMEALRATFGFIDQPLAAAIWGAISPAYSPGISACRSSFIR